MMKLMMMLINELASMDFDCDMQNETYTMVYAKNAVVNALYVDIINPTIVAPPRCPMHFGKLRFTMDVPTATLLMIIGTAWLNLVIPNTVSENA